MKRLIETKMEGDWIRWRLQHHTGRPKTSSSNVNIEKVLERVGHNPETSTRRRRQRLQVSRDILQRILTKDLGLHAYKNSINVVTEA